MVIAHEAMTMQAFRILFHFYRNFWVATLLISAIGSVLVWQSNSVSYASIFSIVKVVTNVLIGFLFHHFKGSQLYFFYNLGFTTFDLHFRVMLMDMAVWFALVILVFSI